MRALALSGSRRGLLQRLFAAVPLTGRLVTHLEEQVVQGMGNVAGVGGGKGRRNRRKARNHHNPGSKKDNRKGKRTGDRQCATVGKTLKKGNRNRCCQGLVEDNTGRYAAPAPAPLTCGTGGPCLVFLTSTVQQGNLVGLTGADAICQQRAQAANLSGAYKAWLSDDAQSPATRFVQSPGPYLRVDGVTIAANWADLTDGTLDAPITVAETGAVFDDLGFRSWTYTLANGTAGGALNKNCKNWTSAFDIDDDDNGDEGQVAATSDNWTDFASGSCNNDFHLYCFQQS